MPLPPPSDAIAAILETIELARGFAFVVVVEPEEFPELTHWTLQERFTAAGYSVSRVPAERLAAELEVMAERDEAVLPLVLVTESRLFDADVRVDALARMNLRRDAWGDVPVRIVYVCGSKGLEELHQAAPDLMHWRVLLQPLTAGDLPVASRTTYLAWCVDMYAVRDADLVRQGGMRALDDPRVVELPGPHNFVPFSTWVAHHFHGVVVRNSTYPPGYPAKGLAHQWARHALRGTSRWPTPLLVDLSDVPEFITTREIPGTSVRIDELWQAGVPTIVFLIDDTEDVQPQLARGLANMGLRTIIVTSRESSAWDSLGWTTSLVLAMLDPLVRSPSRDAVQSLAQLLARHFSARWLQEGLGTGDTGISLVELAEQLTEQLLRRGQVHTEFFEQLLLLRPRARAEIERVRDAFVGLMQEP